MRKKHYKDDSLLLLETIKEALIAKKASAITIINLKKIENAITDFFIICSAQSSVHANTLAQYLEDSVRDITKEKPWQKEGFENCEWILIDYVNIVVHIFQEDARNFYKLEELWGDGEIENIQ